MAWSDAARAAAAEARRRTASLHTTSRAVVRRASSTLRAFGNASMSPGMKKKLVHVALRDAARRVPVSAKTKVAAKSARHMAAFLKYIQRRG